MIEEGTKAPAFSVKDQTGRLVRLVDFKGRIIVLYFYPKDDTPGCTIEACSFRDNFRKLQNEGIVVLGVSADGEQDHQKFIKKYDLPFSLLADTEKKLIASYEVWKEKSMYGKKYMGIERTTFIIDGKGIIKKIFNKVTPQGHVDEVLSVVRSLKLDGAICCVVCSLCLWHSPSQAAPLRTLPQ